MHVTDKDELKTHLREYLDMKGVRFNKNGMFRCFVHNERTPSASIDPNRPTQWYCFGCETGGDIFDAIGHLEGITDKKKQFARARELFGSDTSSKNRTLDTHRTEQRVKEAVKPVDAEAIAKRSKMLETASKRAGDAYRYLASRGISEATAKRFNVGFLPYWGEMKNVVTFPTGEAEKATFKVRTIEKDAERRYTNAGGTSLFNLEGLKHGGKVFIVEGEIDALSIIEAGFNAVSAGGTSGAHALKYALEAVGESVKQCVFIIAPDSDSAGARSVQAFADVLTEKGLTFSIANGANVWGADKEGKTIKDANDCLTINGADALKQCLAFACEGVQSKEEREREAYTRKACALNRLRDLGNVIMQPKPTPISTGFKSLDSVLGGGLWAELTFIGAGTSVGKTAFCMQIADAVASQGRDVLIFSLEMSQLELMARSVSRLTYSASREKDANPWGVDVRSILYRDLNGSQFQAVNKAMEAYEKFSEHVYIVEGVGDFSVESVAYQARQHERLTGRKPVIVVDYLQILAPYDPRLADKQNTDKSVIELKRLSRELDTAVLVVSSFNRNATKNELTPAMEAFKESGAIEYGADVLLGLYLQDGKDGRSNEERRIGLCVLKNRKGRVGDELSFLNRAPYYHYAEV